MLCLAAHAEAGPEGGGDLHERGMRALLRRDCRQRLACDIDRTAGPRSMVELVAQNLLVGVRAPIMEK